MDRPESADPGGRVDPFVVERSSGEKVAHQVARAIVADVVARDLPDGAPLPSAQAMQARFGVGMPTLREALRLLELNGLISIRPGRNGGPRVHRSRTVDLAQALSLHFSSRRVTYQEVLSTRFTLEPMLARLAAENATDPERRRLEVLLDAHEGTDGSGDEGEDGGDDFHRMVSTLSHEPVFGPIAESLFLICFPLRDRSVPRRAELLAQHRRIGLAIVAGDGELAGALMAEHMRSYPDHDAGEEIVDWN